MTVNEETCPDCGAELSEQDIEDGECPECGADVSDLTDNLTTQPALSNLVATPVDARKWKRALELTSNRSEAVTLYKQLGGVFNADEDMADDAGFGEDADTDAEDPGRSPSELFNMKTCNLRYAQRTIDEFIANFNPNHDANGHFTFSESGGAFDASRKAEASGKHSDHVRAYAEHKDAAEAHAALGNTEMAKGHMEMARSHSAKAGAATRAEGKGPKMTSTTNAWSEAARAAAALARKAGGATKSADASSAKAESSGDPEDHLNASIAHGTAAKVHEARAAQARASGNTEAAKSHELNAAMHRDSAEQHDNAINKGLSANTGGSMSRNAMLKHLTANCACDADRKALNAMSTATLAKLVTNKPAPYPGDDATEDDDDPFAEVDTEGDTDVDEDEPVTQDAKNNQIAARTGGTQAATDSARSGTTVRTTSNMRRLLANASPADRETWAHAERIVKRDRAKVVNELRAIAENEQDASRKRLITNKLRGTASLDDLQELLILVRNQDQGVDMPRYGDELPLHLTENEQSEVLDLESARASYDTNGTTK